MIHRSTDSSMTMCTLIGVQNQRAVRALAFPLWIPSPIWSAAKIATWPCSVKRRAIRLPSSGSFLYIYVFFVIYLIEFFGWNSPRIQWVRWPAVRCCRSIEDDCDSLPFVWRSARLLPLLQLHFQRFRTFFLRWFGDSRGLLLTLLRFFLGFSAIVQVVSCNCLGCFKFWGCLYWSKAVTLLKFPALSTSFWRIPTLDKLFRIFLKRDFSTTLKI